MAIIHKITNFIKKKNQLLAIINFKNLGFHKFNPFISIIFLIFFSSIFFISSNLINNKNEEYSSNFKEISKNNEFSNLKKFFLSKINSPYEEINYIIQNNDTVEKILKKFSVRTEDIKNITVKLKEKNLSNIYTGRKLSLIIKKLENRSNTLVSFVYPVNNTSSVEIRKFKENFIVKI